MPVTNMADALRRNVHKSCKAPNCNHQRRNLGGYCKHHYRNAYTYGHPHGRSIRRKEYQRELEDITQLFEANLEHEGIIVASKWLDNLLIKASEGRAMVGYPQFLRLHNHGITGHQILVECSAIWLFSMRNPNKLDDDIRLTYALSLVMLRLMPMEQRTCWTTGKNYSVRVRSSSVKIIGKSLRENLGLLFSRIALTMQKRDEEANSMKEKMFTPFN